MLGQRRRQWTNISPAYDQRLVFAGYVSLLLNRVHCIIFSRDILPCDMKGRYLCVVHAHLAYTST